MKWFGHVDRLGSREFVNLYDSKLKGPNRRGRPLGRWKDKVEEYLEREVLMGGENLNKQGGSVGIRRRGNSSAVASP